MSIACSICKEIYWQGNFEDFKPIFAAQDAHMQTHSWLRRKIYAIVSWPKRQYHGYQAVRLARQLHARLSQ